MRQTYDVISLRHLLLYSYTNRELSEYKEDRS